ncbi:MAG: transcription termination/antitermination NusG family protein [Acetobacteraceae bacterium]
MKEQAARKGLADLVDDVLVPAEDVVELKRGQKVQAERKFFPGYVLVKMEMTDETWHLIKDTPKVTGFLGTKTKPTAISEAEADRILKQTAEGVERPPPRGAVRGRRTGARGGRPIHQLQRHGRGSGRGKGPREGQRLDLRALDPRGPGIRPGRKSLRVSKGPCPLAGPGRSPGLKEAARWT